MIDAERSSGDSTSPIERFIRDFFGRGNIAWPGQDPDSSEGRTVQPYLDVLWEREASEVPVVLPRRREKGGDLTAYVIARDPAHAVVVADLLTAFVGPTYSSFDGLLARLDPADPVDQAVLEFAGNGLVFTVTSPTKRTQSEAWKALDLLQDTLRRRPMRTWHVRKSVGRLLGEFEVALAAGDNSASADLLDQISAVGGLSPTNLANLKIKRLARLGRDAELLRLPGLADIVLTRPPAPIRNAILAAIYGTALAAPLEAGDLQLARQSLISAGTFVLPLLDGGPAGLVGLSGEALAVAALTADIRDDARLLAAVFLDPHRHEQLARVTPLLARALTPGPIPDAPADAMSVPAAVREATSPVPPVPAAASVETAPESELAALGSWLNLVGALSAGSADVTAVLASQDWQEWNPPADEDQAIADILAGLGNEVADRAWLLAGPIVDADGYDQPAARTARQLIEIALLNDRFSPGDLAGIVALADIFLRSGPDAGTYASLLDDLEDESNRWAGPDRATVVLDLVDLLVRAACPDEDARLRLALALLRPLRDQDGRLEPEQARFARQLSGELQIGLDWQMRDEASLDNSLPNIPTTQVLLYSLDERVLERTKTLLGEIAPNVDVRLSHDKVGSQSLKQQTRGAEVIVMATRCAKHAATGFIRQHASGTSVVAEADGSGSASLLRAAIAALRARTGQ
jgi:hypothetical protein